jgi:hypothetical protein
VLNWVNHENSKRKAGERIPKTSLGFRSSENYTDPNDAPRIATIYNGLSGRGLFVPFRKGDPEGNRWVDNEPLYIDWSTTSVNWLSSSSEARWQGHGFFFRAGLTYNIHGRGVALKAKYQPKCVFDASASHLNPVFRGVTAGHLLAVFNSNVISFYVKRFLNNTWFEINDLRQIPIVVLTKKESVRIDRLVDTAIRVKEVEFTGKPLSNEQAPFIRAVAQELNRHAPTYLRPPAQQMLLVTASDALAILELAVNWEAEKLYGVEGLGPFDEF